MTESPNPRVRRHHGLVRLTHWLNAIVLTGMIASGLQIYVAFRHFGSKGDTLAVPNPFDGYTFPEAVRLGGWLACSQAGEAWFLAGADCLQVGGASAASGA